MSKARQGNSFGMAKPSVRMDGIDADDGDCLGLRPAEGKSRDELAAEQLMNDLATRRTVIPSEIHVTGRAQFQLVDAMRLTTCAAVGLAGGYWMPASLFAGVVGFVMVFFLVVLSQLVPDSRILRTFWWCSGTVYLAAALSAVLKS